MCRTMHGFGITHLTSVATATAMLGLVACGGGSELESLPIGGGTVAVVDYAPPPADVRVADYDASGNIFEAVLDVGTGAAKEIEARNARVRLDSAAMLVDVRSRLSDRTLERTARYLGATHVDDTDRADYLMELYVRSFGIDARSAGAARLYMNVEAVLLERQTGRELWSIDVDSHDRLTPEVRTASSAAADIVTAGGLGALTVTELQNELAALTDFTADYVMNELREDLRRARRR